MANLTNSGTNHMNFVLDPLVLHVCPCNIRQSSMVSHCMDSIFAQFLSNIFTLFSWETVYNSTFPGPIFLFNDSNDFIDGIGFALFGTHFILQIFAVEAGEKPKSVTGMNVDAWTRLIFISENNKSVPDIGSRLGGKTRFRF